jgi:hypothetical protein
MYGRAQRPKEWEEKNYELHALTSTPSRFKLLSSLIFYDTFDHLFLLRLCMRTFCIKT